MTEVHIPQQATASSSARKRFLYHQEKAMNAYEEYQAAQSKVDAYEGAIRRREANKLVAKVELATDGVYKDLVGTRNYWQQVMHNEVAMASLYK